MEENAEGEKEGESWDGQIYDNLLMSLSDTLLWMITS